MALGARVRVLRLIRGLAQQDVAAAIGVTFQQVQKYERGANRISASMMSRIARCLQVPIVELVGEASPDSAVLADAADLLAQPGALSLLRAYGDLRPRQRAALVALLES